MEVTVKNDKSPPTVSTRKDVTASGQRRTTPVWRPGGGSATVEPIHQRYKHANGKPATNGQKKFDPARKSAKKKSEEDKGRLSSTGTEEKTTLTTGGGSKFQQKRTKDGSIGGGGGGALAAKTALTTDRKERLREKRARRQSLNSGLAEQQAELKPQLAEVMAAMKSTSDKEKASEVVDHNGGPSLELANGSEDTKNGAMTNGQTPEASHSDATSSDDDSNLATSSSGSSTINDPNEINSADHASSNASNDGSTLESEATDSGEDDNIPARVAIDLDDGCNNKSKDASYSQMSTDDDESICNESLVVNGIQEPISIDNDHEQCADHFNKEMQSENHSIVPEENPQNDLQSSSLIEKEDEIKEIINTCIAEVHAIQNPVENSCIIPNSDQSQEELHTTIESDKKVNKWLDSKEDSLSNIQESNQNSTSDSEDPKREQTQVNTQEGVSDETCPPVPSSEDLKECHKESKLNEKDHKVNNIPDEKQGECITSSREVESNSLLNGLSEEVKEEIPEKDLSLANCDSKELTQVDEEPATRMKYEKVELSCDKDGPKIKVVDGVAEEYLCDADTIGKMDLSDEEDYEDEDNVTGLFRGRKSLRLQGQLSKSQLVISVEDLADERRNIEATGASSLGEKNQDGAERHQGSPPADGSLPQLGSFCSSFSNIASIVKTDNRTWVSVRHDEPKVSTDPQAGGAASDDQDKKESLGFTDLVSMGQFGSRYVSIVRIESQEDLLEAKDFGEPANREAETSETGQIQNGGHDNWEIGGKTCFADFQNPDNEEDFDSVNNNNNNVVVTADGFKSGKAICETNCRDNCEDEFCPQIGKSQAEGKTVTQLLSEIFRCLIVPGKSK